MKIKEQVDRNIAILTISGNMMGGPETTALHEKVKSLIVDGVNKIVIDLGKVKWMNSSGLGVLMACWGTVSKAKGNLKLARATEKVQSLLVMTQLLQFFENYETVDRAVGTFHTG
jgi:anti-sigma B factor antagonist